MAMSFSLTGRVAIITGAAQGIGYAVAKYLWECGAIIIIADIKNKGIDEYKGSDRVMFLQTDVSDPESIKNLANKVVDKFGHIDILVNNAGVIDASSVIDITLDAWNKVLDVDLRGVHLCSQACIPHMIVQRYGRIINIASMAGQIGGLKAGPGYTAAKAGVIGLTKSYARFGACYNITANSICPGFIETPMTQGRDDPSVVPLGRLGLPVDVAKAVFFFASELGDYVTGCNINVNGGLYMGN